MKKALSLLLAIIMLLSLVACGTSDPKAPDPSNPGGEVKYKDRVVIGYSAAIINKDPHASGKATDYFAYRAVHGTLVDYSSETGEFTPDLAESWSVEGNVYTFNLRQGVTFHNGEPFTAKDVEFSLKRMAEGSATKTYVSAISDIRIVNDYTIEIELEAPNAEFLVGLGLANLAILNEKAIKELGEPDGCAIGTGAYTWTELVPEDYALFTRYEDYWGEKPVTKEIVFKAYTENSARAIALQTGEIDVDMELSAIDAAHIAEGKDTRLVEVPTFKLVYLALNINGLYKELSDVRVRQALNYATNVEDIIIAQREGNALAPNGVIPIGVWGYSDKVDAYEHDVDKAKALLAEAGYADGIDIQICATEVFTPIFDILQAQWAEAGINLTLQTSDPTIYSDLRKVDEHWGGIHQYNFTGIDTPLRTIWHTNGSSNHCNHFDPEFDAKLDAAVQELDPDKRLEMYAEISQELTDLACWIPLYQDILLIGERTNVSGMYYGPTTNHDFTYVAVTEG